MDLRRLQVFAKVYEHRSFSRAAEAILLSQPTVSGHIKSLEEELGVNLFDRLGREILPTQAAELLYGYARRVLELVEEAHSVLDAFLGRLRGELVLGGSTIPGQFVLPMLLARFAEMHPEVRVNLSIQHSDAICAGVLHGQLEAGVVGVRPEDDRLSATPWLYDQVVAAAWPGHPLAGRPVELEELSPYSLVLREPGSGTRSFVMKALKKSGHSIDHFKVMAELGSNTAVLQLVRAGIGVGFVSRRAMADDLGMGRLIELNLRGVDLTRRFYLITRRGRTLSPAVQAFLTLCLAEEETPPQEKA